jgi:hypothetical protein
VAEASGARPAAAVDDDCGVGGGALEQLRGWAPTTRTCAGGTAVVVRWGPRRRRPPSHIQFLFIYSIFYFLQIIHRQ